MTVYMHACRQLVGNDCSLSLRMQKSLACTDVCLATLLRVMQVGTCFLRCGLYLRHLWKAVAFQVQALKVCQFADCFWQVHQAIVGKLKDPQACQSLQTVRDDVHTTVVEV